MSDLTLQLQPTPTTCAQACIAMAVGVPVQEVINQFGGDPMCQRGLLRALEDCRIVHNQFVFPTLVVTGWHFAVVPSLNMPGGNHQVLIHFNLESGIWRILDPSSRTRYPQNGDGLKSWSEVVLFVPGGKLPERSIT